MRVPFRVLGLRMGLGLVLGLVLASWSAAGQNIPTRQLPPVISNLRFLTRNSGYIFDGTVLSVNRSGENEINGLPTVQVTFRVERAIRGTRSGQVLTLREWAGLWAAEERYRPGERLLLFFYSPGRLGLTSPVGGRLGRFAVDSGGNLARQNGPLPAPSDPPSQTRLRGTNRVSTRALALAIQRADRE